MYEARQNKEKVSRRIDATGGLTRQRENKAMQKNKQQYFSHQFSNELLQRKVGFEFQTIGNPWNVYKKTNTGYQNPGHGEFIEQIGGINVETDGVDLEFITPPIEEDKKEDVSEMATKTKNILSRFISRTKGSKIYKIGSNLCYEYNGFYINLEGNTTAHPQATVGVKMENIIDLLTEITNIPFQSEGPVFGHTTYFNQNVPFSQYAYRQQKAVIESVMAAKEDTTNTKVQGFIALIEQFIRVNKDAMSYKSNLYRSYNANAKNKMPVMPRTSLKDLYQELSDVEKDEVKSFLNKKQDTEVVMYQASQYMGDDSQGNAIFISPPDGNRYTIADLKKDLFDGEDIFSARKYNSIGAGIPDETTQDFIMFETSNSTLSDTSNVKKAIFELRSLPNSISQDLWGEVVKKVAEVLNRINNPTRVNRLPPLGRDRCCPHLSRLNSRPSRPVPHIIPFRSHRRI